MTRIDWDSYFMKFAIDASERSTCIRRKVGAIITKDNVLISSGYNGAPRNLEHCSENEDLCIRTRLAIPSGQMLEMCRAVHAEQNAILQATSLGRDTKGGTIYVTTFPCVTCAKLIIQNGITKIVYKGEYNDTNNLSNILLQESKIELKKLEDL